MFAFRNPGGARTIPAIDHPLVLPEARESAISSASAALSFRAYLTASRTALLVIPVALIGIFLPALIVPYGAADDYPVLSIADGLGPNVAFGKSIISTVSASGRPLAGVLDQLFFSTAGTIDNLRFIRLAGVIGVVLLALLLHWALARSGVKGAGAVLIVLFICTIPSFQEYGAWAVMFNVPYAAILAGGASLIATGAVDEPGQRVDRIICASALLLGSLLIYQPGAMFFWVFLAVALIGTATDARRAFRVARMHFAIGIGSLGAAYVIAKLIVNLVGSAAPNPTRNHLTGDPLGKAKWFFKDALFQSLNLGNLTPVRWLAVLVALVVLVGVPLLLWQQGVGARRAAFYILVGASLVPLTYVPNLVVQEDTAYYRTQIAITSLIALYFCLGAVGLWLTVRPRLQGSSLVMGSRIAMGASVAVVVVSVALAARNVTMFWVLPQTTELRLVRSQVATLPPGLTRVAFAPTAYFDGMAPFVRYDEFGLPSTSHIFVYQPMVYLVLREEGRLTPGHYPTVDALTYPVLAFPKNEPVINLALLQDLR